MLVKREVFCESADEDCCHRAVRTYTATALFTFTIFSNKSMRVRTTSAHHMHYVEYSETLQDLGEIMTITRYEILTNYHEILETDQLPSQPDQDPLVISTHMAEAIYCPTYTRRPTAVTAMGTALQCLG